MHDTGQETGDAVGCRKALDEFLLENEDYIAVHLLDRKILGMSIISKL